MKISALILTKNEALMIEECLKQLDFADEIIVLDQNSTDETKKIVSKYTSNIFNSTNDNFDANRNILAQKANNRWLLYLDADERLNHELIMEIKQKIKKNDYTAYYFPRKNIMLGKWVKNGNWWPDYSPRLFRKDKLKHWIGKVHESPQIEGQYGYLINPITHLTARNLSQMLNKSIKYKIQAFIYY